MGHLDIILLTPGLLEQILVSNRAHFEISEYPKKFISNSILDVISQAQTPELERRTSGKNNEINCEYENCSQTFASRHDYKYVP